MQRMTSVVLALGLGVAAGCAPKAETAEQAEARMASEMASARSAIDAANARYMAYMAATQGDSIASLFAEDGRMMAPNMPAAVGRQAIAAGMAQLAGTSPSLTLTTESVAANGPLAIERGNYRFSMTPPGAKEPITETGKYIVHWHKMGDHWMIVDDIWNSDQPAMPMGPPAKP
jgi:uncharacterized protein (TIGR02246 family)